MIILADGTDVSSYISTITWSGDINQMARKLSFDYLYTDLGGVAQIEITVGSRITMHSDSGELLFDGVVITEEFDEAEVKKSIQAADYAFYLKSEVYGEFIGTPGSVASMVLGMFGIATGQIFDAGGEVSIVATGGQDNIPDTDRSICVRGGGHQYLYDRNSGQYRKGRCTACGGSNR